MTRVGRRDRGGQRADLVLTVTMTGKINARTNARTGCPTKREVLFELFRLTAAMVCQLHTRVSVMCLVPFDCPWHVKRICPLKNSRDEWTPPGSQGYCILQGVNMYTCTRVVIKRTAHFPSCAQRRLTPFRNHQTSGASSHTRALSSPSSKQPKKPDR